MMAHVVKVFFSEHEASYVKQAIERYIEHETPAQLADELRGLVSPYIVRRIVEAVDPKCQTMIFTIVSNSPIGSIFSEHVDGKERIGVTRGRFFA